MHKTSFGLVLLAAAALLPARTGAQGADWYTRDYRACAEKESTLETVECIDDLYGLWDDRLNAAYRQALDFLPVERGSALDAVQQRWLAYREASCRFYGSGHGALAQVEAAVCLYVLTRDRALELETLLER